MDLCTLWPDALFGVDWGACCRAHDLAYMAGDDKLQADRELALCVGRTAGTIFTNFMGFLMGAGVGIFGWFFYRRRR